MGWEIRGMKTAHPLSSLWLALTLSAGCRKKRSRMRARHWQLRGAAGAADQLIIVPDDELSLVSFSALVDANKNFVGAARSIRIVPTAWRREF